MSITLDGKYVNLMADFEILTFLNNARKAKGKYRVQSHIAILRTAIIRIFDDILGIVDSMTVRQIFYALVSRAVIEKTENGYKKVMRQLRDMRRERALPYAWIADNTRWRRKPRTYADITEFIKDSQQTYRKAIWNNQDTYVEIWCEKDALAGVIGDITNKWDVPLYVIRGQTSDTYAHNAMESLEGIDKPVNIYYFGDWDPSGKSICDTLEKKLVEFAQEFHVSMTFERVAVLPEQIEQWNLPTRPTKKGDPNAKNWKGGSVELDAIPPQQLQQLVEEVIDQHVNQDILNRTIHQERLEKESLKHFLDTFKPNNVELGSQFRVDDSDV